MFLCVLRINAAMFSMFPIRALKIIQSFLSCFIEPSELSPFPTSYDTANYNYESSYILSIHYSTMPNCFDIWWQIVMTFSIFSASRSWSWWMLCSARNCSTCWWSRHSTDILWRARIKSKSFPRSRGEIYKQCHLGGGDALHNVV